MSLLSGFKKAKKYVKQSDGYALLSQKKRADSLEERIESIETKLA